MSEFFYLFSCIYANLAAYNAKCATNAQNAQAKKKKEGKE